MPLTDAERLQSVEILLKAERDRKQATQLSTTYPHITIEDAYWIQSAVTQRKVEGGRRVRGHKVGLTSKAMQLSSQIDEPDYGHLLDNMFYDDGAKVEHASFCVPRVELELAFVLGKPLKGPGIGLLDVLNATEWVVPAIEIIDARVQNPRKIFDTVADNGAAAAVVLGGRPVRPTEVDLRWVPGLMYRNAEIEESGVSAAVLGHPAMGIAWLANKVGPFGTVLEPGHLTLAGSFIRPVWANKGDTLRADFGPLGSVSVQFV